MAFCWQENSRYHPPEAYDPEVHLNLGDLSLDCHTHPTLVRLKIKQSKTDPFRQGVGVFLGRTDMPLCPVQALVQYLEVRSPAPGPLFNLSTGSPLSRSLLVANLHTALRQAGLDESRYNGHSFRIGAAAQQGLEDSLIQTLGIARHKKSTLNFLLLNWRV